MSRNAILALALLAVGASAQDPSSFRTINGSYNNPNDPLMGSQNTPFSRWGAADYTDGVSSFAGESRPDARIVSNTIFSQSESIVNSRQLSDFIWQWGQFLDHDLTLTPVPHDGSEELLPIVVPPGDEFFDPEGAGDVTIEFTRSTFDDSTGDSDSNPRQQINIVTDWVDASQVYGSDDERAMFLRTMEDGLLRTSQSDQAPGDFLPINTELFANENFVESTPDDSLFLGGDLRANDQIGLMSIHTLFVREHNRLAGLIKSANDSLSDEEIYQYARKVVGALAQTITYNEWLPALLGEGALEPYTGYDSSIDGTVRNEFSTACLRVGHTMLTSNLAIFFCEAGQPMSTLMREVFFTPEFILEIGIEPVLQGLATAPMQEVDNFVIDDVRNFLFGQPGEGGMDLVSLNVHRGRDHGIIDFNSLRVALGLPAFTSFSQITSNADLAQKLEDLYGTVDNIDPWVGNMVEDHITPEASFGETLFTAFKTQFELLRDGDRFFYLNDDKLVEVLELLGMSLEEFENIKLSDIFVWNTEIEEIQSNVFMVDTSFSDPCANVPSPPAPAVDESVQEETATEDAAMGGAQISIFTVLAVSIAALVSNLF